jgi:hypothetical protein
MAAQSEVEQALLDAIKVQADLVAGEATASYAANYAAACASLSEALAWLRAPAQPHGGGALRN